MNPTLDRLGRRIGRIGDGDIHPECVANYVDLYPDRKGYAERRTPVLCIMKAAVIPGPQ